MVVGVAIAGLAALSATIAGAQTDDSPRGTDPLSENELSAAAELARGSNPGEAAGLGDDDVVLLVERHEEAKADEDEDRRRADVYVYSYDDDVLTWSIVDTATGEVDRSSVVRNTQLPLIQEEEDRALEIALADPSLAELLATRYRQATGRDLADPATDLDIQPIVFLSSSNPAAAAAGAGDCGRHRCAQLMIQSTDDVLVDLLPIIDLSSGQVLTETGFFS
jgi:hypothetical protein